MDSPLFEVTTPAADAAARRLTTAAKVRALIGSPSDDDAKLEAIIDGVSAECARYCNLARPANMASPPTFAEEVVKATWLKTCERRTSILILPWRVAISGFGQVVEDGVNLTVNVDYQLIGGGMLERLRGDSPAGWSSGKIIVPYTAGWVLPAGVSAELESQVIKQVSLGYYGADRDPGLRSDSTEGVGAETYAVIGGDSIGESGFLKSLETVLASYRSWLV